MKKLIVIMICVGAAFTAAAQKVVRTVPVYHHVYAFRPVYGFGIGYYPPFYSPFGYYGLPYGAYYPYGAVYSKPTRLEREEENIVLEEIMATTTCHRPQQRFRRRKLIYTSDTRITQGDKLRSNVS